MLAVRVIGPGRAGRSLAAALGTADVLGRNDDLARAADGCDLVVIATPDSVIAGVASVIEPVATTVVAHMAGSLGLDVLAPHARRASLHPLRALATGESDLRGGWWAVAGDPLVRDVVGLMDGRVVEVADRDRAKYHAAAAVASNHLVALLGSVERIAAEAGVPLEAYLDLVRQTVDNVERLGPADALTGPVKRGDWATVERHLAALPEGERTAYQALADLAQRLTT